MLAYKAAQLRTMLPKRYKNFSSVDLFKSKITTDTIVTALATPVEFFKQILV